MLRKLNSWAVYRLILLEYRLKGLTDRMINRLDGYGGR